MRATAAACEGDSATVCVLLMLLWVAEQEDQGEDGGADHRLSLSMFEWWSGRKAVFVAATLREPVVAIGPLPTAGIYTQGWLERLCIEPLDDDHYGAFLAAIERYKWVGVLWRMPSPGDVTAYIEARCPADLRPVSLWPGEKEPVSTIVTLARMARLGPEQWRWALWRGRDSRPGFGPGSDVSFFMDNADYAEMDLSRQWWDTPREAEGAALEAIIADWHSFAPIR